MAERGSGEHEEHDVSLVPDAQEEQRRNDDDSREVHLLIAHERPESSDQRHADEEHVAGQEVDLPSANGLHRAAQTYRLPFGYERSRHERRLDDTAPQCESVGIDEHDRQDRQHDPQVRQGILSVEQLPNGVEQHQADSRHEAAVQVHPKQHGAGKHPEDVPFPSPDALQPVEEDREEQVGEHLASDQARDSREERIAQERVEQGARGLLAFAQADCLAHHHEDGTDEQRFQDEDSVLSEVASQNRRRRRRSPIRGLSRDPSWAGTRRCRGATRVPSERTRSRPPVLPTDRSPACWSGTSTRRRRRRSTDGELPFALYLPCRRGWARQRWNPTLSAKACVVTLYLPGVPVGSTPAPGAAVQHQRVREIEVERARNPPAGPGAH